MCMRYCRFRLMRDQSMGGAETTYGLVAPIHTLLAPCGGGYRGRVNPRTSAHRISPPPRGKGVLHLQIRITMRTAVGRRMALGLLLLQGVVWAAEPVAVLTELRMGQGEVQVKFSGEADWMAPQLLLALQPGD